jgi:hypothetical protein
VKDEFHVFVVWNAIASISVNVPSAPVHVATGMFAPVVVMMHPEIAVMKCPEPLSWKVAAPGAMIAVGVQEAVPENVKATVEVLTVEELFEIRISRSPTTPEPPRVQFVVAAEALLTQTAEDAVIVGALEPKLLLPGPGKGT